MEQIIPIYLIIPFALMLLCVAVLPLTRLSGWWEGRHDLNKLLVSLILGIPVGAWFFAHGLSGVFIHQIFFDYIPFILLLSALYVTTGGIRIQGNLKAVPNTNVMILGAGYILASFVGTTGAAMLLIRLLLETNRNRKYRVHSILFFIAAVANCGGLLTPLGDPPLFLLFQKGAGFTWFFNLVPQWALAGFLLLTAYYFIDGYFYRKEYPHTEETGAADNAKAADNANTAKLKISGGINFLWLLCVIASTMFINPKYIPAMGAEDAPFYLKLLREWAFIAIILMSLLSTKRDTRRSNSFTWGPIIEVAFVFVGIFATMPPALMYLQQHPLGIDKPWEFFLFTGLLSAFLDNAPTAMVFHAAAGTLPLQEGVRIAAGISEELLAAISAGAVFFGSLTYIGNGPNFMVKSIAEQYGVKMPSFFGYMAKFSLTICLPIFIVVMLCFFL